MAMIKVFVIRREIGLRSLEQDLTRRNFVDLIRQDLTRSLEDKWPLSAPKMT